MVERRAVRMACDVCQVPLAASVWISAVVEQPCECLGV